MSKLDETISQQFREWEMRGRGGRLFERPVALEPPFVPFTGYRLPTQRVDDGRRPTGLSKLWHLLTAPKEEPALEDESSPEPDPIFREAKACVELQLTLPESKLFPSSGYQGWLRQVCRAGESFAFELFGTAREIVPQFAGLPGMIERIDRALPQFLPGVATLGTAHSLGAAWLQSDPYFAVVELGLGAEFVIPLAQPKADVLSAVVNAMEQLRKGELALYQVLVEPAIQAWEESVAPAIATTDRKPVFLNRPDLLGGAERKLASPFFAVVVRFATAAAHPARCWEIMRDLAAPFAALAERGSNYLIPLSNEGYDLFAHENDILDRTSHRSGMLLNADELISFIAFPTAAVSRRLRRQTARTAPATEELRRQGSLLLGANPHAGRSFEVWLRPDHRTRHMHLIGASGMGKSTLLFNLIRQDIERGQGIALLDPHGDLVERVLGIIPPERREDVVLVDPSDEEHIVGFNILAAHSDFERNLLASDLVSTFRRLSTSWGEQMNSVLRNAILAFLESSRGGTLADLRRFLLDAAFRKEFLRTVSDPDVVFYWERAFPQLTGNKSIGPVLTRLDEFLSRKPIRYMVSQHENRLDFADILDRSRILLVKLPQGQIGRENANLLGSVIVSKIQQIAMSRQRMRESERRDFWVYLDEFHSFITPSMAEILTGARKYRVGLILAHQELHQLETDRDVASAVLANCCTRIAFRVSDRDAHALESGFAHFEARDLQNLRVGEAICRVERSEADFNLLIPESAAVDEGEAEIARQETQRLSNARYAKKRAEVEAELLEKMRREVPEPPRAKEKKPPVHETGSEKESTPAPPPSEAPAPVAPPVVSEAPPVSETPRPPGMGRGGENHQLIVANLASEASRLGFRSIKECVVEGGRIDLVIQTVRSRIAVEVAVNSNTAHEIENLQKCAGMEVIVSVSPHPNVRENIAKAASRAFDSAMLAKMRFEAPESLIQWLQEIAATEAAVVPPDAPKTKIIAGRKVQTRHLEMSPEERKKKEAEELEIIADLLRNRSSKKDTESP
jgi:hypothetical protein